MTPDTGSNHRPELPPGPRWPAFLQVLMWGFKPISFLNYCSKKFGHTFTMRLPGYPPFVVLTDPEAIREVFTGDVHQLHAGKANAILKPIVGQNSLLLLDEERHQRERAMMLPPFHGERMFGYGEVMRVVTDRSLEGWPVGRFFSFHPYMQSITLDIILRTVFGLEENDRLTRLRDRLTRILAMSSNPAILFLVRREGNVVFGDWQAQLGGATPWGRAYRLIREVDALLFEEFARRRSNGEPNGHDILTMLLRSQDSNGKPMTDQELRDEMMTLLVAGHETTATALAWTMASILDHPEVERKVRAEIDREAGGTPVSAAHVPKLDYLDATIRETLRLRPVIPFVGRILQNPTRVASYDLPANVMVAPSIYLTQRRPDLWPEPEVFRPERFLDSKSSPYVFLPFGGGVRRCIGMSFALFEMKIVLARILQRTRLKKQPGYHARVIRRSITFAPSKGVPVILESRSS